MMWGKRLIGALTLGLVLLACGGMFFHSTAPPVADTKLDLRQGIDTLLEPIRQKHDLPALAAAVIVGGKTTAVGAVGFRKYGGAAQVTVNDQFHLGSNTKTMTATLIGRLIEEGKLRWGTTIGEVFPELAASIHPEYRNVTLEQLLSHRGGFPENSAPPGKSLMNVHKLPGTPMQQRLAYIQMFLRVRPAAVPGSRFIYSNTGYAVAGAMAERVMKVPWEKLMTQMLFKPLGMTTAGFGAMGTPGTVDQPWQHTVQGPAHQAVGPGPLSDNPTAIGPAGTVHCSIGDWAKFVAVHLKGARGHDGLLKAVTIRKLQTPSLGGDYALGWLVTERDWGGGRVLTHAGSNTMSYAVAWMAPRRDFAVLIVTNQGGDGAAAACDDAAGALIGRFLSPA